jgi:hypothetical protein
MRSMIERKVMQGCASLVRVFTVICAVLLAGAAAYPQGSTGRILGVVTDKSGGNVAGANVTITDAARGVSQTLATDSDGAYVAVNVLPGTYTLRAEFKGFKVFERKNILVEVGKDVRIDAVLQPGSTNETITITEEVPMVDTTSTTLGGTISNEIINDLPLNGRNYQNLLTLRPGTMVYPGGGPWTQSTNGIRPEDMGYIIDGLPDDEAFMGLSITNAAAVLGDAATILPVDAIQEFNTQVNPKAEFGWKPGAVTSVGLKSGTNEIHGSAYAYGRSDSFDARNFFNHFDANGKLKPKTPVELEQFGGTAGGHIIKDKLFYFGGYEQQRYTVGSALFLSVPTTASLGGDAVNSIPDALASLKAANLTPNSASLGLLGCPTSAPFTPCTGALFGSNSQTGTNATQENPTYPNTNLSRNALGKVDYHLNDRHSVNGSYFFGNDGLVGEDSPYTNIAFLTRVHSRAQAAAGHWAWTPNSQWANELRFGYTRYTLSIVPGDAGKPASSYGLFTGVTNPIIGGLPNLSIGGFTAPGNFFSFPKFAGPDSTYDLIDQVSHSVARHTMKFGGQFRDIKVDQATWRRARGQIFFSGGGATVGGNPSTALEDFLLGIPSSAKLLATTSDPVVGSPERHMTQKGYAAFIQDDWRIVPRVTLNLGLRYEYATPPSEAHNLLGSFDPALGVMQQVGKQIPSLYNGDHKNFSPRVGVAWDVTGKGTTIVRAGGSLIYDLLTMNTFLSEQNTNNAPTLGVSVIPTGAPIVTCPAATCGVTGVPVVTPGSGTILSTGLNIPSSSLNWPGSSGGPFIFPGNLATSVQCGDGVTPPATAANPNPVKDPGPCSFLAMDRNYKTPYVSNWTFGIQHAFSSKLSLEVAYVGNHGSKLTGIRDLNQPDPANGFAQAYGSKPYLGVVNFMSNIFMSNYNGLQATLTARNYHGLGFIVGYTYSHALDNMSYNWNQYLPQNSLNPGADYGSSDFDITHRFTLSLTYAIPGKKTWGQLLEGWQINSILTLQSAQPWSMYDSSFNFSQTGEATDRWDLFGSPKDFKSGGPHGIPCFGPGNPACTGAIPQACLAAAAQLGLMGTASLTGVGLPPGVAPTNYCYMVGKSVLVPNAFGSFGTTGRNIFRDTGFRNLDLSVTKAWKFRERLNAQFRAEAFNVLNHSNFANPWGGTSGYGPASGFSDPSFPGNFGCGCNTPDAASANPVLGSGSARAIQLGLKLTF